jgi:ATP:ADP antiporter, AAA family
VKPEERAASLGSFAYFFFLLAGYYVIRPLRETMGLAGGVKNLQWLFSATFTVMLLVIPVYSALVARFSRRRFIPWVYRFFALNLCVFFVLMHQGTSPVGVARAFFVWTSVYNLFVVTVFWSFMADVFTPEQGKRLFGFISAGGSLGAIAGPAATTLLLDSLGMKGLLLLSAALLEISVWCVAYVGNVARALQPQQEDAVGGGAFAGFTRVVRSPYLLGIAGLTGLLTLTGSFLYFQQANIVDQAIPTASERAELFAQVDLVVNVLTLLLQALGTGFILRRLGLVWALLFLPLVSLLGFGGVALWPGLSLMLVFSVLRRAGHYALEGPAKEILFIPVTREDKYKAKSFIDTVVHRGGDVLSAWLFTGVTALGVGVSGSALLALPVCVLWTVLSVRLAKGEQALRASAGSVQPSSM